MQEYEEIRRIIGEERYSVIEDYLNENPEITFDKLVYNKGNWDRFDKWFNDKIKLQKVEILNTWVTNYDDIACNAILYKNDKAVANIIDTFDETSVRYAIGDNDSTLDGEFVKNSCTLLINENFNNYLKLPKISDCSKLLISIYDSVCESDSSMCHIDNEDWNNFYTDYYNEEDIKYLEEEIEEYHLKEVIEINNGEYKIVGYGDLQTMFNDDRHLVKENELDEDFEL